MAAQGRWGWALGCALGALLGVGCKSEVCGDAAPAVQIEALLANVPSDRPKSIEVAVAFGDSRYRRTFEIGSEFADGKTSVNVELLPAPAASLPAIAAGQMAEWLTTHAYGYGHFATILDDLTVAVADADPTVDS